LINPEELVQVQEWFSCNIPRKEFKTLLKRDNYHAVINFGLWFVLLGATGYLAYRLMGTAWVFPAFFLYGVVYASGNAKWHECSHGTPFKTNWLNEIFYFLGGSMELRDIVDFKWSHTRHHSYTIFSGIDPEFGVPRPPKLLPVFLDFFYLRAGFVALKNLILHSIGITPKFVKAYVPDEELARMHWWARAALLPHLIAVGLSISFRSWLPVLFFGLPRFYGGFFQWTFILLQHAGLDQDTWDHRLTTRSLKVNFFFSFLFMNMENHIEHHIYPMVPFHALSRLHKRVKDQLPRRYNSMWDGCRELLPVLFKQKKDPDLYIKRVLPSDKTES
jgi:fatty acid desaturase